MTTKIFIDGEVGTTGLQIRERLETRSDLTLISLGEDRRKDINARKDALNAADVAILCLPDEAARESVSLIENASTRVIDASTAHRTAPGWTYGFAEMDRDQTKAIAGARFVANIGCWPLGLIATMRPLIAAGLLPADYPVTYSGISGYSGGGKAMIADYAKMGAKAPQFIPYALTFGHKHLPEMTLYGTLARDPLFVPAVGDYYKGMLTVLPLQLGALDIVPKGADIHAALADHFTAIPGSFVRLAPLLDVARMAEIEPEANNGNNWLTLYVCASDARAQVAVIAVYDNLGKGASGGAVQNLNLMIGADPATGL
ncbi:MAG: N-acetyl-gamma-glutamyl-phosphate reductase [Alphaproteobacteria bacterium]|nr:N-acetyl-gamma-glutamyl-phosphate reductase [Alphaproteobacteria bacterium]